MTLKAAFCLAVLASVFSVVCEAAQSASSLVWITLDADDDGIFVSIPENFSVNAPKRVGKARTASIISKHEKTTLCVGIAKLTSRRPFVRIPYIPVKEKINSDKLVSDKKLRTYVSVQGANKYWRIVVLFTRSRIYTFSASASDPDDPLVRTFFNSIVIEKNSAFDGNLRPKNVRETIDMSRLEPQDEDTSSSGGGKKKREVEYKDLLEAPDLGLLEEVDVPPVMLLTFPLPTFWRSFNDPRAQREKYGTVELDLLDSGEVGDIIVFTDESREYKRAFKEAASDIPFVPAVKDGKTLDVRVAFQYSIRY